MNEPKPISTLRRCPESMTFKTAGGKGGPYTVKVRDAGRGVGIEFVRVNGRSKSMSAGRFMKFWAIWSKGTRDLGAYRNESGRETRAAAATYALPVFEWIARQQSEDA